MKGVIGVLLLATRVWAQPCVGLNKICGDPGYPDCCGVMECVGGHGSTNGRCRDVSTVSSTTTTTTNAEPPSDTTSTTNPDVVQFPALRATPDQISFGAQGGENRQGLRCWHGHFATQPERAAMQGKLLVEIAGELARYSRRMGFSEELEKINDLLTITGVRFFGNTGAYEGRTYPPQLDPWNINLQGAGDLYQFGWYRLRGIRNASVKEKSRAACGTKATPDVLAMLSLQVNAAGECEPAPYTVSQCADVDDADTEGQLIGSRMFPPPSDPALTALKLSHTLHAAGSKLHCDKNAPRPAGSAQAAHMAYENLLGSAPNATASVQHFARIQDFSGYMDTYANRRPDDPDDPALYWTDKDECDLAMAQDEAHGKWMECEVDGGPWGKCQFFGRLHQFLHLCAGFHSDDYWFEFPRADGLRSDKVEKQTCAEYLAAFRANGGKLP
jgi:hypothetical protein